MPTLLANLQESAEAGLMANASNLPPRKTGSRMRMPGTKGWSSSNPNSITLLDLLATVQFKKSPAGVYLESVPRVREGVRKRERGREAE